MGYYLKITKDIFTLPNLMSTVKNKFEYSNNY